MGRRGSRFMDKKAHCWSLIFIKHHLDHFYLDHLLTIWLNRSHGEMTFYLTQAMTGHGCFRSYLKRFRRAEAGTCLHCCTAEDDAEHALFHCTQWDGERQRLGDLLGPPLSPDIFMNLMLEEERKWREIEDFIEAIMRFKAVQLKWAALPEGREEEDEAK